MCWPYTVFIPEGPYQMFWCPPHSCFMFTYLEMKYCENLISTHWKILTNLADENYHPCASESKLYASNLIHFCSEGVMKTKAQGGICALCKGGQIFICLYIFRFPDKTAVSPKYFQKVSLLCQIACPARLWYKIVIVKWRTRKPFAI